MAGRLSVPHTDSKGVCPEEMMKVHAQIVVCYAWDENKLEFLKGVY